MASRRAELPSPPLLLTPGPLSTSPETRAAATSDWGSREADFIALTARVRTRLTELAGDNDLTTVPIQGSGTFAVEAMLATLVPASGRVLILANGAYGRRMAEICRRMSRSYSVLECAEDQVPDVGSLDQALKADPGITHVAAVQVETTSGILNPIESLAAVVATHRRRLLIDAMSGFGALALDAARTPFEAVAASSNKCLEGLPGLSFVIAREDALSEAAGRSPTLSLDLHDQWRAFEANGQWRFTPPTQIVAALDTALDLLAAEGGTSARLARYQANLTMLRTGMTALGFRPYLSEMLNAPIIATFHPPSGFDFEVFHRRLLARGFAIYPGKLTAAPSFRVGCIGQVFPNDMQRFVAAVSALL
jgi:2-aminoethylphosphonate-pyruvate transaminase